MRLTVGRKQVIKACTVVIDGSIRMEIRMKQYMSPKEMVQLFLNIL